MTQDLARDHDDLRASMRDFSVAMDFRDMPDIARRRIAFSRLFSAHLMREDAAVDRLRRGTSAAAIGTARDHGRAITALFLHYSDHIKFWTPAQIESDWAGYRNAVLGLQQDLETRMSWEERHLHPLTQVEPSMA